MIQVDLLSAIFCLPVALVLWQGPSCHSSNFNTNSNGAEISYDCAHGSITEKIVLDGQGHFSARGRHVREHPGPIRDNEKQNEQSATYRGSVSGDTMNLTVILSDSDETVGTFTLTHGKSGRLRRCG